MNLPGYAEIFNVGHRNLALLYDTDSYVAVQEKIDGSQLRFGLIDGELLIASKRRMLNLNDPDGMFAPVVQTIIELQQLLTPGLVYYGEYLSRPHHNVLTYDRIPRNYVVLFDIEDGPGTNKFLSHVEVQKAAQYIGFDSVRQFTDRYKFNDISKLEYLFEETSQLGGSKIEGMVFKQYELRDTQTKKLIFAKWVAKDFREKHNATYHTPKGSILDQLGKQLTTDARMLKAIQHLKDDGQLTGTLKDIGPLIGEVARDVHKEEKDWIAEQLFNYYWKSLAKKIVSSVPGFYKNYLGETK